MANMSYCRFENTYSDLRDCVMALELLTGGDGTISRREWQYAKMMRSLCDDYLSLMNELEENDAEDFHEDDDDDDAEEDFDHYEVCSDGLWYKFYERDNAVAFACGNEYPIFGVKDGKREPVQI